jgi:hypothetical protein
VNQRSTRSRRSRHQRGQALVEFTLITPVLILFVLLTVDVGRAFWESIDAAGAARAGVRMGIISDSSDIGAGTREEPNTGIPNTLAAWGAMGPGTAEGTCTASAQVCGDPNGCVPSSFSATQIACFAIRSCNLSSGGDLGTCTSYGQWGYRPVAGGHGLLVVVVIKFPPVTPALPLLIPGRVLYLTQSALGDELYF